MLVSSIGRSFQSYSENNEVQTARRLMSDISRTCVEYPFRATASIAQFGDHSLRSQLGVRQIDMTLADIDDPDLVAVIGKPAGMHTRSSANVEDPRGR